MGILLYEKELSALTDSSSKSQKILSCTAGYLIPAKSIAVYLADYAEISYIECFADRREKSPGQHGPINFGLSNQHQTVTVISHTNQAIIDIYQNLSLPFPSEVFQVLPWLGLPGILLFP